jgi:hypothetical protein
MSAKIVSIRSNKKFVHNYCNKWELRLLEWARADIERGGGWLRGNNRNIRPHRHPLNISHNLWYLRLQHAYALKVRIDLITHAINNPHF